MNKQGSLLQKVWTGVGAILCVIFIPLLVINITLIVKSYTNPNQVPDFMGYKPFIVLSGSMEPSIMTGDMVFVKSVDTDQLQKGDVIAFRSGEAVITHRITDVVQENGEVKFITQGDANNAADETAVSAGMVEGRYTGRIAGLGDLAMFMQTTTGMILFVVCPLLLFVIYDLFRRKFRDKKEVSRTKELEEELERLKAEKNN